ncbi:Protein SCAI-like protein [Smittium mucronatum]|uniref:Protein SCAI-like protein n=1 Tax=Smittium mucronatum TaxID=133383 RepID=A0A1R0GMD2_9FUNG|nr:Protein SCAI-like protein [Smittium mucronatum]
MTSNSQNQSPSKVGNNEGAFTVQTTEMATSEAIDSAITSHIQQNAVPNKLNSEESKIKSLKVNDPVPLEQVDPPDVNSSTKNTLTFTQNTNNDSNSLKNSKSGSEVYLNGLSTIKENSPLENAETETDLKDSQNKMLKQGSEQGPNDSQNKISKQGSEQGPNDSQKELSSETINDIVEEFEYLLEKSQQLFSGIRSILENPMYYGLKRWEIGEIASKIGQLYYQYYLKTSDLSHLTESYTFYNAVIEREYFMEATDVQK